MADSKLLWQSQYYYGRNESTMAESVFFRNYYDLGVGAEVQWRQVVKQITMTSQNYFEINMKLL